MGKMAREQAKRRPPTQGAYWQGAALRWARERGFFSHAMPPDAQAQTAAPAITVLDWGRTRYAEALAQQEALLARRIAGEVGDTLVFTEHEPVFTLGRRSGADAHLLWSETERAERGIALAQTNRGGDITYHGPGQIVGYPIISLNARRDLHAYLRLIEQVLINVVGALGLAASRRAGLTGIWIGERKIAAIGVAVKRWVAYHGFALNVAPDLAHFGGIVPCGIAPTQGSVTSLAAELGAANTPALDEVKRLLAAEFRALLLAFNGTTA